MLVDTPPEERVDPTILSADQTQVYVHRTPTGQSRHHLSFNGMPTGVYTIRVKSHRLQLQQQVMLRYENQQAVLRLEGDQVVSKR